MDDEYQSKIIEDNPREIGLVGPTDTPEEMTAAEREAATSAGKLFAAAVTTETGGQQAPCLAIIGQFPPLGDDQKLAEIRVRDACLDIFGYPGADKMKTINILLDSPGGSLDSAFKIVRYLTCYADDLNVYVPRRAKSASTLLALGAARIYLSQFGELGPLDTQIFDPRNPVAYVSALDCYQSVDHVRQFGITAMNEARKQLSADIGVQAPLADLLGTASAFGTGAIEPMLRGVRALDFGAWGRSLKIGEMYARLLLLKHHRKEADRIASRLVYDYTHHLFPIDYREARDIGLQVGLMGQETYQSGLKVLRLCGEKVFIGWISQEKAEEHADVEKAKEQQAPVADEPASRSADGPRSTPNGEHPARRPGRPAQGSSRQARK